MPGKRSRLNWRQRRKLGLTFASVLSIVRDMDAADALPEDSAEAAIAVADRLRQNESHSAAYQAAEVDWDTILDFLQRLIELIRSLFNI